MLVRIVRWALAALSLMICYGALAPAWAAIEVTCIEASKYKYLYRIFDNNPARFAAFFNVDPRDLPPSETCRAALFTGEIEKAGRDKGENDFDRLLAILRQGRGWLSTLYLASPGGNIIMGLRLGELTRMFWLDTNAIQEGTFEYVPNFLAITSRDEPVTDLPPDLQRGWQDYLTATQAFARVEAKDRHARRCASACTYLHVGGIYRQGTSFFHRGKHRTGQAGAGRAEPSMTNIIERLQKAEQRVIAFYRDMDAGEAAIQMFQSTASETVRPSPVPLLPRYVRDFLKKQCSTHARRAVAREADFPANADDIRCIARSNSHERLMQFSKLCRGDCDRNTLYHETSDRIRALLPGEQGSRRRSAR